ncbi:hypothetical protein CRYUN_Cryun09bG0202600 [Craigia yunnanensis]
MPSSFSLLHLQPLTFPSTPCPSLTLLFHKNPNYISFKTSLKKPFGCPNLYLSKPQTISFALTESGSPKSLEPNSQTLLQEVADSLDLPSDYFSQLPGDLRLDLKDAAFDLSNGPVIDECGLELGETLLNLSRAWELADTSTSHTLASKLPLLGSSLTDSTKSAFGRRLVAAGRRFQAMGQYGQGELQKIAKAMSAAGRLLSASSVSTTTDEKPKTETRMLKFGELQVEVTFEKANVGAAIGFVFGILSWQIAQGIQSIPESSLEYANDNALLLAKSLRGALLALFYSSTFLSAFTSIGLILLGRQLKPEENFISIILKIKILQLMDLDEVIHIKILQFVKRPSDSVTEPIGPLKMLSLSVSLSEIKNTWIFDDYRSIILFESFGFGKNGHIAISIRNVTWTSRHQNTQLNPSSMGFFITNIPSFRSIWNESVYTESFCVLSSRYAKLIFNFENLNADSTYSGSIEIDDPDEYNLVFGNCQPEFKVSMHVHTEMYNLKEGCFFVWVFACINQRPRAEKIHLIMGALLLFKCLKMICASEDKMHNVVHCDNPDRNRLVIPETIPSGTRKTGFDDSNSFTVFFPIIWSIRSLREASKTDGKAAKNLEKLTLFKQFYIVVIGYLYFTIILVSAIGDFLNYRLEWLITVLEEGASFVFYAFIFYNFQKIEKNPYLLINDEEENGAAAQMLEEDDPFEL